MTDAPRLRVLLTRPRPDAEATAQVLAAHGIEALVAPLLEITDSDVAPLDLADVQVALVTSANGVRALARATPVRDLPVLAVGDASAAVAQEEGFTDVASAAGDVAALADVVRHRLNPKDGALLHAAGSAVAGDLAGDLARSGFTVRRVQLYEARTVETLPAAAAQALAGGTVDAVLLYSPRTANQFTQLVSAAGLREACRSLVAVCLSPAVASAAAALPFAELRVAATPEQQALIATLLGTA